MKPKPIKDIHTTPLTKANATPGTWVVVEADSIYETELLGVVSSVQSNEQIDYTRIAIRLYPKLLAATNDPYTLMYVDYEEAYYDQEGQPVGVYAPLLKSRVKGVLTDQPAPYPWVDGISESFYDNPSVDGSYVDETACDETEDIESLYQSLTVQVPGYSSSVEVSLIHKEVHKSFTEVLKDVSYQVVKDQVKEEIKKAYQSSPSDIIEPYSFTQNNPILTIPGQEEVDLIKNKIEFLYKELAKQDRRINTLAKEYQEEVDKIRHERHLSEDEVNKEAKGIHKRVHALEKAMEAVYAHLAKAEGAKDDLTSKVTALLAYTGLETEFKEEKPGIYKLLGLIEELKQRQSNDAGDKTKMKKGK